MRVKIMLLIMFFTLSINATEKEAINESTKALMKVPAVKKILNRIEKKYIPKFAKDIAYYIGPLGQMIKEKRIIFQWNF